MPAFSDKLLTHTLLLYYPITRLFTYMPTATLWCIACPRN